MPDFCENKLMFIKVIGITDSFQLLAGGEAVDKSCYAVITNIVGCWGFVCLTIMALSHNMILPYLGRSDVNIIQLNYVNLLYLYIIIPV